MQYDTRPSIPVARFAELADFYRRKLLCDVVTFWQERTRDIECGGYLTCFDRQGHVTDTDKYTWFQARQVWMFASLCNRITMRQDWLDLARCGRDFLVEHAYAGRGRWHYQLDREGRIKQQTISIYSDLFVLGALCEYAVATGRDEDLSLITATYDAVERNARDPRFKDLFHGTWSSRYQRHGVFMITLCKARVAAQVLGDRRVRPLIDHCLEQLLRVFAVDEHEALLESIGYDGAVGNDAEGRLLNPGHALESMWFCMEEALEREDAGLLDRAATVAGWMYHRGHDPEHGGILSYVDLKGGSPPQTDWHRESGISWDDKVWWVHSEALYALALAGVRAGREDLFAAFEELHEWSWKHFSDSTHGEWYTSLYRDGRVKNDEKGNCWKAAYHLPRAMLKLALLFESCRDAQSLSKAQKGLS